MDRDDLEMIADGLERILSDARLEDIDRYAGQGEAAAALWATLAENGYPRLCAGEEYDGLGGSLADMVPLAMLGGRSALAAPLADTMLAIGLLSRAGVNPPDLRIAIANPLDPHAAVAHAGQADAILVLADARLRLLSTAGEALSQVPKSEDGAARINGDRMETLAEADAPQWLTSQALRALGALRRAASMAGAMQAALELTLAYTGEREQFGRPLSKFQAIQHHLSDIACETAASTAAAELAADALAADPQCGTDTIAEIAIAKVRCGQAAARVAAAAHQAHGAMGFTREYALGRFTRRLWQWQDEFGTEAEWAAGLGLAVLASADPALWPRISA